MTPKVETAADAAIRECLLNHQSFALVAGAGSGKTRSLVDALSQIRDQEGPKLRQNGQRVACITFTKRAVEVIRSRVGFDSLFIVSTLHSFLWEQIGRFQADICDALRVSCIPSLIAKEKEKDDGGKSRKATDARAKARRLELELASLGRVERFVYGDTSYGDYENGKLSHDDIIAIAAHLLATNATLRRIIALRFPFIFVDEAQDTFEGIVNGLNLVAAEERLATVGYFGDPWQQIYDDSVGTFTPPTDGKTISKTENFRCSNSVIRLLNAFRDDVEQFAAGDNKNREGSVVFRIVKAEKPELPRNRYSEAQIERALSSMDAALLAWGWNDRQDVIKLFLVRQMIARRMGFAELNRLFNGPYASSRAEEQFVSGKHFLLLPLTNSIYPLITAHRAKDSRRVINVLRRDAPAFAPDGPNASKSLKTMVELSIQLVERLELLWTSGSIRQVLQFGVDNGIVCSSEKLLEHLRRATRFETYDESLHALDKGDWLADQLFEMKTTEIASYSTFISTNSAFSTQHGVKGEEYPKVLVVYDDTEANWNTYSFAKILTPQAAGQPTDGQRKRGRNLVYVSLSRAMEDLRVLFFTPNPEAARDELIARKLVLPEQIQLVM